MFYIVTAFFLIFNFTKPLLACPEQCYCPLTEEGHHQVLCLDGGLTDPIPVLDMSPQTQVLFVSAPGGKSNRLTLGPLFRKLPDLEQLHIVHSRVPALGENSFWGLRKLETLNVSYNTISALLVTNFGGLEELKVLDLSHNRIESIPSTVFKHVEKLHALNMSYNLISELVPQIFFGLSELEKLDLSYNPLGDLFDDRFSGLTSLNEFSCAECGLLKISQSVFQDLQNLEYLDLSNNKLTLIPPVKLTLQLSVLTLNGNHIVKIRGDDLSGNSLEEFYISNNRITHIDKEAFQNFTLKNIDLSYNRLSTLKPQELEPILPGLKSLDISGNFISIEVLKVILPKARQLRKLGIGHLGLTYLPLDLLRRSRHLRYLNISHNYLSKFPHQLLYSTPHLQNLDLSSNNFRGLSQNVVSAFRAMSSLTSIHLEKNPWQCEECYIAYLINWLKLNSKQLHSLSSCENDLSSSNLCLKCAGPEKYAGQPLVLLNEESLAQCVLPPHAEWPSWNNDEAIQPNLNDKKGNIKSNNTRFESVASFFKDHLALLIGIACGLILAIMLVIVTALACSKKQSGYYSNIEDENNKVKLMSENQEESNHRPIDPTKVAPYEPMAILKVHSRSPICPGNIKRS